MEIIEQQLLTGERALFKVSNKSIKYSTFTDGESPLKECCNINLYESNFKWKYPLWYCNNINLDNCTLFDMARAGIWYSQNVVMKKCTIQAPKIFRRSSNIKLYDVTFSNAQETMWHCQNIKMVNTKVIGDYFAMDSSDIEIDNFEIIGNYSFDGGKNITIRNARLISKDAFWNAENVNVYDSYIAGEYLGWNSKNITFVNCIIESLQGLCYMKDVKLVNCKLLNTNLAFEYSTVDAEITSNVDSIKNPIKGNISVKSVNEIIFDDPMIDQSQTLIKIKNNE